LRAVLFLLAAPPGSLHELRCLVVFIEHARRAPNCWRDRRTSILRKPVDGVWSEANRRFPKLPSNLSNRPPRNYTCIRLAVAYFMCRTSQECGPSTALSPDNSGLSGRFGFVVCDATICWQHRWQASRGGLINRPLSAALFWPWPRHVGAPLKLLTTMS